MTPHLSLATLGPWPVWHITTNYYYYYYSTTTVI